MYVVATVGGDVQSSTRILLELRRDAAARGLFAAADTAYGVRLGVCLAAVAALAFVAWTTGSATLCGLTSALAGFMSVQAGFVAHDAGHGAVSRHGWRNALAGQLAFSVVNGLGFQSWKLSHDAHHAHSQDESADPDMQVDVVMSLTPRSAHSKTGVGRWLLLFQGYYLWPLSTLFAHSLRIQSLVRSYREPLRFGIDAVLLPLHYAFWFALPVLWLEVGFARAAGVYLILSAVVGTYLALLFWVNHVGMPVFSVLREEHARDFLEQQVVGTRNVRNPAWLDWFFGGLNFQIEHHLLPGCPGMRLRRAQQLVRAACDAAELPYHEERFPAALGSVTKHVFAVARAGSAAIPRGSV